MWNDKPDGYPIPAWNPTGTGTGMNFYPWVRVQISIRSLFAGGRVIALPDPLPSLTPFRLYLSISQSMATQAQSDHKDFTKAWPIPPHCHPNHLIKRGSQTAYDRKLGYHDSCTLYKGSIMYPRVVISSLAKRLQKPPFSILILPLVYGPEITTCHYKGLL
jgi:hypothetical protein